MSVLIEQTDRAAELSTLHDELAYMTKRLHEAEDGDAQFVRKLIAQIERDIERNESQLKQFDEKQSMREIKKASGGE